MTTRADMIAEIEGDIERSDDSAAVSQKIGNAIRHYEGERFWFNETRSETFNTVIDQQDYGYGTDIAEEFIELDGIWLTFGTSILNIDLVDFREIEALRDATNPSGVPIKAAYVENTLAFYPKPNGVYAVRLAGLVKKAAPADDAEANNVWMNEGYDLIKSRAKAELYAVRYRDTEGAAIERVAEQDYFSELKRKTTSKIGTGSIRPTQF